MRGPHIAVPPIDAPSRAVVSETANDMCGRMGIALYRIIDANAAASWSGDSSTRASSSGCCRYRAPGALAPSQEATMVRLGARDC